jgi:prevent-host-death family protein
LAAQADRNEDVLMRQIGSAEARNKLGQLLDWVQAGEDVLITRHGRPVARLVASGPTIETERARNAAAAIRAMSKGVRLSGPKCKELIADGRL